MLRNVCLTSVCDTVAQSAQAGGGELVKRVPAHLVSANIQENFIESYFSARNLGLVMHLDCFKCNHHQWKLSNKLHEPNDFYCLKKYILKPFLLYPYFFPPTLRMTGPESLLSARMRNGDGGRSSSGSGTSPSLTASWHHHDHDNIQWINSFGV